MQARNRRDASIKSVAEEKNDHVARDQSGQNPRVQIRPPKKRTRPERNLPPLPDSIIPERRSLRERRAASFEDMKVEIFPR